MSKQDFMTEKNYPKTVFIQVPNDFESRSAYPLLYKHSTANIEIDR